MKSLKEFDIEIFRLKNGRQNFDYELNDKFFAALEDSVLEKGNLKVTVMLDKSERLILSEFIIQGTVELVCDRCLEPYDYKIECTQNLVFKFGEEFQELSEDVIMIPRDLQKLNLAQYIYEFIGLEIPMKKLHPKFGEEDLDDDEETEVKLVYSSDEKEKDSKKSDDSETIDPRWNKLKDLKNKLK